MDQTAQDTTQLPQPGTIQSPASQQVRPVAEPPARDTVPQPQTVPQQQPAAPKTISVGTEMGRFQITDEDEDDKGSSQQYTPLQFQTPSEITHQPTTEKVMTQSAPQSEIQEPSVEKVIQSTPPSEIISQPSSEKMVTQAVPQEMAQQSMEPVQPAVPEVEVPKEIGHLVQKAPLTNNPFLPPELQNVGVKHTIPQVAVPPNEYGIKELPLPYEEAVAKEKAFRPQDAGKWIAAKVHYYWRKINPEVYK